MSAPIFISYSSKDQETARTICGALETRGHECWISCRDVQPGENFQEAIVQALRSARVMLLVFTSNANNSDEIKKELVLAGRHRVAVVPIRVEDVVPSDAFAYELATRQWVDLFKDWEQEIELLVTRVGQILQATKPPDGDDAGVATMAIPPRRAGASRRSHHGLVVTSALGAAVLVFGGAVFYLRPLSRTPSAEASLPQQTTTATTVVPSPPSQPVISAVKPEPSARSQLPAPSPAAQVTTASPTPESPLAAQAQTPPAETPSAPPLSLDEAAWQSATAAGTIAVFNEYLNAWPAGAHVEEAQLRIADMILASPIKSKIYDGKWLTRISCPTFGRAQGYSVELSAEVKDGAYHAGIGIAGDPGSLVVDGKIGSDGTAALLAKGFVGSAAQSGGMIVGTSYFFHVVGQFEHSSGTGKRIEFRPCNLTFVKQ